MNGFWLGLSPLSTTLSTSKGLGPMAKEFPLFPECSRELLVGLGYVPLATGCMCAEKSKGHRNFLHVFEKILNIKGKISNRILTEDKEKNQEIQGNGSI